MTDPKPAKAPKATAPKAAEPKATAPKAPEGPAEAVPPVPPVPPAPVAPPAPPAASTPPAPPAPQPYAQQPYGSAGYQPQYGPRTNTLAIISLVASLAGLFVWFLGPVAGVIMGHIALGQIKRTGEGGRALALAGTIIGYVFLGLSVLVTVIYVIFFVALVSSGVLEQGTVI